MMTITLKLPPEVETKLRESIARQDGQTLRQLLAEAFAPTVEEMLQQSSEQLNDSEFEIIADQLADELVQYGEPNSPLLSDYAVSRAGIYGDHP